MRRSLRSSLNPSRAQDDEAVTGQKQDANRVAGGPTEQRRGAQANDRMPVRYADEGQNGREQAAEGGGW